MQPFRDSFYRLVFASILFAIYVLIRFTALLQPAYRNRLKQQDLITQIKVRDKPVGRHYRFNGGKVTTGAGIHPGGARKHGVQVRRDRRPAAHVFP